MSGTASVLAREIGREAGGGAVGAAPRAAWPRRALGSGPALYLRSITILLLVWHVAGLGHKDHRLALEMADQLGVTAPVGRATMSVLDDARRRGFDGDDVTSLLRVREEDAGVTVRLAPGPKAA